MVKSEAKKFMEEIMMIEKRQSQRLIGDITTGYRYVDTDTAERIAEAKRRRDKVDAMRYSLITDTLKTQLNKVYGIKAYEKENKTMNYEQMYVRGSLFGTKKFEIKNVIFNGPCTIVQWSDGDKTIVKCENEDFDKEKGLAMAICKKFLGTNKSKSNYNDVFKKWIPEEKVVEEKEEKPIGIALSLYAKKNHMNPSTLRKMCREGKIPAIKINDKWYICMNEE